MANLTALRGACQAPFLQEESFPTTGGFIDGRFCAPMQSLEGEINCCIPCPLTDWVYPNNFLSLTSVVNWITVAAIVCCVFLLLSMAVLPTEYTHRHYLSVCLLVAVVFMELGFIIPLGAKPNQCYNDITPNDMYTSVSCALSGAFLLAGGLAAIVWTFIRTLSLHLQICYQFTAGTTFFYCAQLAGWLVPGIFLAVSLAVTGVSYRFGNTCHINHHASMADFWGPILGFSGITLIIQLVTFGYCIKVYLKALGETSPQASTATSGLPSYNTSFRSATARQRYKRIMHVLSLQWRGIAIASIIVADVIFFSVVFVYMDNATQVTAANLTKAEKWLECLVLTGGNKDQCLPYASDLVTVNMATILAVLILISLNGIWTSLLLGRFSIFTGWIHLITRRGRHPEFEFVSVDARRVSAGTPGPGPGPFGFNKERSYEMLTSPESQARENWSPEPGTTRDGPRTREPSADAYAFSRSGSKSPAAFSVSAIRSLDASLPPPSSPPEARLPARQGVDGIGVNGMARMASPPPRGPGSRAGDRLDYADQSAHYRSPASSFSVPRAPSQVRFDGPENRI